MAYPSEGGLLESSQGYQASTSATEVFCMSSNFGELEEGSSAVTTSDSVQKPSHARIKDEENGLRASGSVDDVNENEHRNSRSTAFEASVNVEDNTTTGLRDAGPLPPGFDCRFKSCRPESARRFRPRPKGRQVTSAEMPAAAVTLLRPSRVSKRRRSCEGTDGPYGKSPATCNRHLMLKASGTPPLFAEEMNETAMTSPSGLKAAKQAELAVRKAKAQVCLANLATARQAFALGVAQKKYERLEADMIRSRVELVNFMGEMERERHCHAEELDDAGKRQSELEVALRAADEVLRQLTAETKRQRNGVEDREDTLRARITALEDRLERSESECKREKLSTWSTVARETERAAFRERYRMTAFLQRYVLETQFLRASLTKAEDMASDLHESSLQPQEGSVTDDAGRTDDNLSIRSAPRKASPTTAGPLEQVPATLVSPGRSDGGKDAQAGWMPPLGEQRTRGATAGVSRTATATPTKAELAVRRLENRMERSFDDVSSISRNSSRSGSYYTIGNYRQKSIGGTRRGGFTRAEERRLAKGRVSELLSLLTATENDRDSLASLLVLAERRMESMAASQEELALKLAWDHVSDRQLKLQQQRRHQQQNPRQKAGAITEESPVKDITNTGPFEDAGKVQPQPRTAITSECNPPETLDAASKSESIVENLDLSRQVRDLKLLQKATEAGARLIEEDNRHLRMLRSSPSSSLPAAIPCARSASASMVGAQCCGGFDAGVRGSRVWTSGGDLPKQRRVRTNPEGEIRDGDRSQDQGCRYTQDRDGGDDDRDDIVDDDRRRVCDSGYGDKLELGYTGRGSKGCEKLGLDASAGLSQQSSLSVPMSLPVLTNIADGSEIVLENESRMCITCPSSTKITPPIGWSTECRPGGRGRPRSSPIACEADDSPGDAQRFPPPWSSPQHWSGSLRSCHQKKQRQQGQQRHRQRSKQDQLRQGRRATEAVEDASTANVASDSLLKDQIAWVLGLPAGATTGKELLAAVMHLVVARGTARTDATTLEENLAKMDAQSLSLTHLAASSCGALDYDGLSFFSSSSTGFCGGGEVEGSSGAVLRGDGTFIPSVSCRRGDAGGSGNDDSEGGDFPAGKSPMGVNCAQRRRWGERRQEKARPGATLFGYDRRDDTAIAGTKYQKHSIAADGTTRSERPASCRQVGRATASNTAALGTTLDAAASPSGEIRWRNDTTATAAIAATAARHDGKQTSAPGQRAAMGRDVRNNVETSFTAVPSAAATTSTTPRTAQVDAGSGGDAERKNNSMRASFPRTLQGRLVSIDISCTKVVHEGFAEEHDTSRSEDDDEYEIRVEAYDPAVLKHHVLIIREDDIRRCFTSHPHLYTLGPSRRRVHQSLADRLILMPEDEAQASLLEQNGEAGDIGNMPLIAVGNPSGGSPPSLGNVGGSGVVSGSGGIGGPAGGRRVVVGGSGTRDEPNQVLVLVGDAGEIILAEKTQDKEGTDAVEEGTKKHVHRFAKSAIMQIEKEEEIVEGVVFQYEPPVDDERDEEAAFRAKTLATMDSVHSSQEYSDEDDDDDEDDSDYECSSDEDEDVENDDDDDDDVDDDDDDDVDGDGDDDDDAG